MRNTRRRVERIQKAIRQRQRPAASDNDILKRLRTLEYVVLPDTLRTQQKVERLEQIIYSAMAQGS